MRIIPAIDLIEGKCVRLTRGDYSTKKVYNENPLEVAKEFEAHGIKYLHLVDLDGARASRIINHKVLEAISTYTSLKIDFGGGVKSDQDIRIAFESGANQVTGGSIALKQPDLFLTTQYTDQDQSGQKTLQGFPGRIALCQIYPDWHCPPYHSLSAYSD